MNPLMNPLKRLILATATGAGYVVLKKEAHEKLLCSAASAPTGDATTPVPAVVAPATSTRRPPAASGNAFDNQEVVPASDLDTRQIEQLVSALGMPAGQIHAMHTAIQYLSRTQVIGEIIDCGDGSPERLALIAALLLVFDDRRRDLVLYDATGDPWHRPESELTVWGPERDPLSDTGVDRSARKRAAMPLPEKLVAIGYPAERIALFHYPVDPFARGAIAYLGLTSETYEANRAAIKALVPRVSVGGVIGVTGEWARTDRRDAVAEYFAQSVNHVLFWRVSPTYRIGLQCGSLQRRE